MVLVVLVTTTRAGRLVCSAHSQRSGLGSVQVTGTAEHKYHRCRQESSNQNHGDDGKGVIGFHGSDP